MSSRFNPPNRNQLANICRGDERLIRSFEQLFDATGQLTIDALNALEVRIDANEARIKTNEVLLWLSM